MSQRRAFSQLHPLPPRCMDDTACVHFLSHLYSSYLLGLFLVDFSDMWPHRFNVWERSRGNQTLRCLQVLRCVQPDLTHCSCLALDHYTVMLLSAARSYLPLPAPVEALLGRHAHLADSLPVPLLQETCSCPGPFTLAISSAGLICLPFPWFRSFLIFKASPNKISSDWYSLRYFCIK